MTLVTSPTAPTPEYNPGQNSGASINGDTERERYSSPNPFQAEDFFDGQEIDGGPYRNVVLDKDYYPFIENVPLPDKKAPEDLDSTINRKEKIGACIYVIEKKSDGSWKIEFFNNKFYLNTFSMSLGEKVQITETFNTPVASFFDQKAKVYVFNGASIDWTTSDPELGYKNFYQSGLIHMYNNVLRGTKLIDNNRIAVLSVANHYIYGYPIAFNVTYSSNNLTITQFQTSWLISEHQMSYPKIHVESELENLYKVPKARHDVIDSDINATNPSLPSPKFNTQMEGDFA